MSKWNCVECGKNLQGKPYVEVTFGEATKEGELYPTSSEIYCRPCFEGDSDV